MFFSRLFYYLSSIPTLFWGIRNWPGMTISFLVSSDSKQPIVDLRNSCRFQIRTPMDVWIIKETCLDRQYQRSSVEIKDGWSVLDIGAGLGDFAICVAKNCPSSVIHAYEPFPESFELLKKNLNLNHVSNVKPYPNAVSKANAPIELHLISTEAVQQSTVADQSTVKQDSIRVMGVSLDQALREMENTRCDYLKMDCEGAEYEILLNTSDSTLARIDHICLEYHDGVTQFSHVDLVDFLTERGFYITLIPNPVHEELGLLYAKNQHKF